MSQIFCFKNIKIIDLINSSICVLTADSALRPELRKDFDLRFCKEILSIMDNLSHMAIGNLTFGEYGIVYSQFSVLLCLSWPVLVNYEGYFILPHSIFIFYSWCFQPVVESGEWWANWLGRCCLLLQWKPICLWQMDVIKYWIVSCTPCVLWHFRLDNLCDM